ncbi:MAG TPA: carcinine hydrolase/isopenicillin-N N-acyltransferase family protein [Victivallales bacterium]|nr:carcinine hydrolase/isopenicillin-N N-acyltransferase family protein [Victivallales bacterium]
MNKIILILLISLFGIIVNQTYACSVFSYSNENVTIAAGNNDQPFDPNATIYCYPPEKGMNGVILLGYPDQMGIYRQGMNDKGLCWYITGTLPFIYSKNPNQLMVSPKTILQKCSTVKEAVKFLKRYQNSFMMFGCQSYLFADKYGNSAIVAGNTVIYKSKNKNYQILTNFRQNYPMSKWYYEFRLKEFRYKTLSQMLTEVKNPEILSFNNMLNAVEWGPGTQISSICDLKNQVIYVYLFHNFTDPVKINLKRELANGKHQIHMSTLFKKTFAYTNAENSYKIPIDSIFKTYLNKVVSENETKVANDGNFLKNYNYHKDLDKLISKYKYLKKHESNKYDFSEYQLEGVGTLLTVTGWNDGAIEVYKLNTESFPNSSKAFQLLANAYKKENKINLARVALKKANILDGANLMIREEIRELTPKY